MPDYKKDEKEHVVLEEEVRAIELIKECLEEIKTSQRDNDKLVKDKDFLEKCF